MRNNRYSSWIVVGCLALAVGLKLESDGYLWPAVGLVLFFVVAMGMAYRAWKKQRA